MQTADQPSWFCPACGHQNQMSFKHCTECGTPLQQGMPIHHPPQAQMPAKRERSPLFWVTVVIGGGLLILAALAVASIQILKQTKVEVAESSPTPLASATPMPKPTIAPSSPSTEAMHSDALTAARRHVEEFNTSLSAPAIKAYMASAKLSDLSPDDLEVTVTSRWHYEPKTIRLQMAQVIWKAWAGIHRPEKPDAAYLTLRDATGNKVGGSRIAGGSFIWVAD